MDESTGGVVAGGKSPKNDPRIFHKSVMGDQVLSPNPFNTIYADKYEINDRMIVKTIHSYVRRANDHRGDPFRIEARRAHTKIGGWEVDSDDFDDDAMYCMFALRPDGYTRAQWIIHSSDRTQQYDIQKVEDEDSDDPEYNSLAFIQDYTNRTLSFTVKEHQYVIDATLVHMLDAFHYIGGYSVDACDAVERFLASGAARPCDFKTVSLVEDLWESEEPPTSSIDENLVPLFERLTRFSEFIVDLLNKSSPVKWSNKTQKGRMNPKYGDPQTRWSRIEFGDTEMGVAFGSSADAIYPYIISPNSSFPRPTVGISSDWMKLSFPEAEMYIPIGILRAIKFIDMAVRKLELINSWSQELKPVPVRAVP